MTKVTIDLGGVHRKLSEAAVQQGRYSVANQMVADMNQFIPMREGNLRQSVSISTDATSIHYNMPYAGRLFYMYMYNYTTHGTGPRWDLKAKSAFMSDWIDAFTKGADW